MKIQILGSGCPKCQKLEQNAREALEKVSVEAEIVKVTDPDEIADMGIMMTPGLAIDGSVKISGRLASVDEIVKLL
jgi:small redox-active disulfide protein 2